MTESTCVAGLEHNVISFNAAIFGCATGQQWQCGEARHTALGNPYVISFNAAISAYGKSVHSQSALMTGSTCRAGLEHN
eukprot:3105569-Karenia_brevis.AAC.1